MPPDYSKFIETTHPLNDKQGTKLLQGTRQYQFLRNAAGAYVAEVLDDRDREAILSISQGYRIYNPSADERRVLNRAAVGTDGIDTGSLAPSLQQHDEANAALAKSEQAATKTVRPPKQKSKSAPKPKAAAKPAPAKAAPAKLIEPPSSTGRVKETAPS
jgi:hypothetical protein